MGEWLIYIWLGIFVFALAIELVTADMVSVWFAIAAIPSFILSLFSAPEWLQIGLFIVILIVLIVYTRPVVVKYFKVNEIKTNVDAVIGQTGIVLEEITPTTIGRVKLRAQDWSAISDEVIKKDENVRVLDVEGVKLIVKKI